MSEAMLFVAGRLFLAAILAFGGIYALRMGYRLYVRGIGLKEDGSDVTFEREGFSISLSLKRVGSVVMVTSVAWGALSWMSKPQTIALGSTGDQEFTSVTPKVGGIENLVATIASERGSPESALEAGNFALRTNPQSEDLQYLRAAALANAGQFEDSEKAFQTLLASRPDFVPGLTGLANFRLTHGDVEGAIKVLEAGRAAAPKSPSLSYALAQVRLSRGEVDQARDLLESIIETDPDNANASNDLAWILASHGGDLSRALELAEKAVSKNPSPDVLDTLGWVHYRRGEADDATRAFERALEKAPNRPEIHYRLGLARMEGGDSEGARSAFREAIKDVGFSAQADARATMVLLEASRGEGEG